MGIDAHRTFHLNKGDSLRYSGTSRPFDSLEKHPGRSHLGLRNRVSVTIFRYNISVDAKAIAETRFLRSDVLWIAWRSIQGDRTFKSRSSNC
ncbi:MAG: hypothetical protein JGK39_05940 [Microcoleus sp. PH2017_12_PCY_D_A]|uniref:hypothetical protein n=1 Tax=Microcoleus sp. PH2017_12_PCY_D_A TaxID=2798823 RepID=UPI001DE011E6|nr:hypothetical protein [Microcoleus sp. PH2017_12_PCY_D_A]MCC3477609.1 hypothetical protein [Microcoleus sp. PH2017_12_PCY_D_A]